MSTLTATQLDVNVESSMPMELSALVAAARAGDELAGNQLFAALYSELHSIAKRELARCAGRNVRLTATSLLHQAYMAVSTRGQAPLDRKLFIAYTAQVMRRLVIDHVRAFSAQKRGAGFVLTTLEEGVAKAAPQQARDLEQLERISAALDQLALIDRQLVEIVDLKFFCGMSFDEIAAVHETSERTVVRRWAKARALLRRELSDVELE